MRRTAAWTTVATAVVAATALIGSVGAAGSVARPARRRREREAAPETCGPSWSVVGSPGGGYLEGVAAVSSTSAWAVGYVLSSPNEVVVQHWDGASWTAVDAPPLDGGRLVGVTTVGSKNVWAVGYRITPGAKTRSLIEHGTPKGWKIAKSPSPDKEDEFNAVGGSGPNDVWAVGRRTVGKKGAALVEHYDGSAWTVSDTTGLTGQIVLTGVRAFSPSDAWAVGSASAPNGRFVTVAAHWDGTSWTRVSTPNASTLLDEFTAVGGAAGNDVWAVGETLQSLSGPVITTLAEHWDGTKWRIVTTPNPTTVASFTGVTATTAGNEVAVGPGDNFRFPVVYNWNGSAWSEETTPQAAYFTAVATSPGGPIWAVGERDGDQGPMIEESCP